MLVNFMLLLFWRNNTCVQENSTVIVQFDDEIVFVTSIESASQKFL